MKHVRADRGMKSWEVVAGSERSQAATMALEPGDSTAGGDNRHQKSDQWLYVLAGKGKAVVEGREVGLEAGSLLLIEAGENHDIVNTGNERLLTVNVYAPPAYGE